MNRLLVVAEHRNGELRDITYEMLKKALDLSQGSLEVDCLLIQGNGQGLEKRLMGWAHRVLKVEQEGMEVFKCEVYQGVIQGLMDSIGPSMVFLPHTPWGMDLAPALSVATALPLAPDCVDVFLKDGRPRAMRQIYGGKLLCEVKLREAKTYLFSIRPGSVQVDASPGLNTQIEACQIEAQASPKKRFLEYVETGEGEVDISQAQFLVSIGRGVGEQERIEEIRELTQKMGAVLSCSRPIVDKNWLPKYHQVGTSGKTVKPKVYLALGISGAFQHVAAIKGSGTIIAVNKDKKAPIFRVAHFGVAEDLFKIVEALKEQVEA